MATHVGGYACTRRRVEGGAKLSRVRLGGLPDTAPPLNIQPRVKGPATL